MENWLTRTESLIGKQKVQKLQKASIAIFGLGGVGSFAAEALVRSGIGNLICVDHDKIEESNINRQLLADTSTIGISKVEVAKNRFLKINPNLNITIYPTFYKEETSKELLSCSYDYIIDAIDSISSKLHLIETAKKKNIPIISCMGTGNKLDPFLFEITDITKTSVCPLAKIIRKELKKRRIENVKVLFSKEPPYQEQTSSTPASISFVPSIAGLMIAGEVIKDIIS